MFSLLKFGMWKVDHPGQEMIKRRESRVSALSVSMTVQTCLISPSNSRKWTLRERDVTLLIFRPAGLARFIGAEAPRKNTTCSRRAARESVGGNSIWRRSICGPLVISSGKNPGPYTNAAAPLARTISPYFGPSHAIPIQAYNLRD